VKPREAQENRLHFDQLSFFLLWIVLGAGLAAISHNIFLWLLNWIQQLLGSQFISESLWRLVLLDAILLALFTAPVEKLLLKMAFGKWVKGWVSSRMLSIVLSVMPYILLQPFEMQSYVMNTPQNIIVISFSAIIFALPQVWVLRRYIQNSWQYLFAAVASAIVPIMLLSILQGMVFGASMTVGLSAAITALMMLWLFRTGKKQEKPKAVEARSYVQLDDTLPHEDDYLEETEPSEMTDQS
jgi:hypothetical protein